jgi:hypothetical protein
MTDEAGDWTGSHGGQFESIRNLQKKPGSSGLRVMDILSFVYASAVCRKPINP